VANLKNLPRIRLEQIPIHDLRGWKKNPRTISEDELARLKKGLEHFGVVDPIITNQRLIIIGGHQRVRALKELEYTGTVPVIRLKRHLTRNDFAELNLALNKISGDWDQEKLAPILQELIELPTFELTGFTPQEANLIIESFPNIEPNQAEDETPPLPTKPITKPGQLWKLGPHRLLCGDATDPDAWKKLMGNQQADLCITDPPYGVDYQYEHGKGYHLEQLTGRKKFIPKKSAAMPGDETTAVALKAYPLIFQHLAHNAAAYITTGTDLLVDTVNWLRGEGIHYAVPMVWDKGHDVVSWNRYHLGHENIIFCGQGSLPGGGNKRWFGPKNESTIWRIPIDDRGGKVHRAQKPVALYERAMINSSAPGDIVADCFSGSGTCIIAAEKHRRHAYLMELDPAYCDLTIKRWMTFTGRKAETKPEC